MFDAASLGILDPMTLIKAVGLIGLLAVIFAESGLLIGFFLPGDSLLFTAGILASQGFFGDISIHLIVALLFLAAVLGDNTGYTLGRRAGPRIFRREQSLLFHPENLIRAEQFYEKYGGKAVLLARFIPIVRTFAPIVAGVGKMKYRRFLAFNIAGGLLWAVAVTYLGYFVGSRIDNIEHYILPIVAVIILLSVAPGVIHVLANKNQRTQLLAWGRAHYQLRRDRKAAKKASRTN